MFILWNRILAAKRGWKQTSSRDVSNNIYSRIVNIYLSDPVLILLNNRRLLMFPWWRYQKYYFLLIFVSFHNVFFACILDFRILDIRFKITRYIFLLDIEMERISKCKFCNNLFMNLAHILILYWYIQVLHF